MNLLHVI